nr:UPF0489 family protein [uncultured Oscillibacter sp.]
MRALDLDMDYFMESIANTPFSISERLSEEDYGDSVWPECRVRAFLEQNLGLSKSKKIPGRIVVGYNESLFFWEELIAKEMLTEPFEVVHVDSHADLGLGCASSDFLQGAILILPVETRRKVREYEFNEKIEGISIGDYLLWGIAYKEFYHNLLTILRQVLILSLPFSKSTLPKYSLEDYPQKRRGAVAILSHRTLPFLGVAFMLLLRSRSPF